jgi:hypothetical protein
LLLYGGGLGALAANRYDTLRAIWTQPTVRDRAYEEAIVGGLFYMNLSSWYDVLNCLFDGQMSCPLSLHLEKFLRALLREFIPDDDQYKNHFDCFEHLQALVAADVTGRPAYLGMFPYRMERRLAERSPDQWVATRVRGEFQRLGENWPPLTGGLFDGSVRKAEQAFALLGASIARISGW